jgi:hypothetical protein
MSSSRLVETAIAHAEDYAQFPKAPPLSVVCKRLILKSANQANFWFLNHMRLLKNSATKSSFLVGDNHQVCYSDV